MSGELLTRTHVHTRTHMCSYSWQNLNTHEACTDLLVWQL